jgi:hypothetical protein
MNMIRTETALITDTCYMLSYAHNKYLPQFSATTTTHLQSYFHYIYSNNIAFILKEAF